MTFEIIEGDVAEELPELAGFDGCLCDPPYGLTANKRGGSGEASLNVTTGFMGKGWDRAVPSAETWALVLEALKPSAPLLAFGGTRTYHRLAVAIEDGGFEIRDTLCWLYGSGFPKSLDIAKAIDREAGHWRGRAGAVTTVEQPAKGTEYERTNKGQAITEEAKRWEGYGTALKPAWEPITLAMRPFRGNFAANVAEHGVGPLNVAGSLVGEEARLNPSAGNKPGGASLNMSQLGMPLGVAPRSAAGRWPANVLLDEEVAAMLDEQSGELVSGANPRRRGADGSRKAYGDFDGQAECDARRGVDRGGASRFFYCAKVSREERRLAGACDHPTLKPIALTQYLAGLILPPPREDGSPRRLLVPFSGAGSEIAGALRAGWDEVVGIEKDPDHCEVARARIRRGASVFA